jgi:hypothetical protein
MPFQHYMMSLCERYANHFFLIQMMLFNSQSAQASTVGTCSIDMAIYVHGHVHVHVQQL